MASMNKFIQQIFRFGVVGIIAATVHFSVVVALVRTQDMLPLVANVIAFIIAFQVSYWGHRLWTFQASRASHSTAIPRLLLVQTINFAANESLFYILLEMQLPYPIALIIVLTVLPIFTYSMSRWWVFTS